MTVGVVGLGLIGGSIGLALRAGSHKVIGLDPNAAHAKLAKERGCVDELGDLARVSQAEIVFVAVPPAVVASTVEEILSLKAPDTIVTDCTSTKGEIVDWILSQKEPLFVGGHPMAGHEKTGPQYASGWMFRGARWVLTPTKHTKGATAKAVEALIKEMGATPVRLDPQSHDRHVALFSHLPHVLAGALVQLAADMENPEIAGPSWKDLTRVGGADPDLWTQILMSNRKEIAHTLDAFSHRLHEIRAALEEGDESALRAYFKAGVAAKKKLP